MITNSTVKRPLDRTERKRRVRHLVVKAIPRHSVNEMRAAGDQGQFARLDERHLGILGTTFHSDARGNVSGLETV